MANILFVTTRIPYPPWEGHQIRTYNLLKRVAQSHSVTLLTFVRKDESKDNAEHLKKICDNVELFDIPNERTRTTFIKDLLLSLLLLQPFIVRRYFSKSLYNRIDTILKTHPIDLIHFDMLPLAQYRTLAGPIPTVLNNHNVESLLLKRRASDEKNIFAKVFFYIQAILLKQFESQACSDVSQVICCSKTDKNILRDLSNSESIAVIANGVDTAYFRSKPCDAQNPYALIFVGGMGWFPNKDGIEFFLSEIFPALVKSNPAYSLTLVGNTSNLVIPTSIEPHVIQTGFVDDFRPYISKAAVYILPLRVGSGTRLKLLEAMSMEKAIVSTAIGAEGISVTHNENILIADTAAETVSAIQSLCANAVFRDNLGLSAEKLATQSYDWQSLGQQLLVIYANLLNKHTSK
jgi:glycosyltransferase involved in cell wall biosynthesis